MEPICYRALQEPDPRPQARIAYYPWVKDSYARRAYLPTALFPTPLVRSFLSYLPFHLQVPVRALLTLTPSGIWGKSGDHYNPGTRMPSFSFHTHGTRDSQTHRSKVTIYYRAAAPMSLMVRYEPTYDIIDLCGETYQTITPEYNINQWHSHPLPVRAGLHPYTISAWKRIITMARPVPPHPYPMEFSTLQLYAGE